MVNKYDDGWDVGTPPFVLQNNQLLYRLAMACTETARRQWAGTEEGLLGLTADYYRETFHNHPQFIRDLGLSKLHRINWLILAETFSDYLIESEEIPARYADLPPVPNLFPEVYRF